MSAPHAPVSQAPISQAPSPADDPTTPMAPEPTTPMPGRQSAVGTVPAVSEPRLSPRVKNAIVAGGVGVAVVFGLLGFGAGYIVGDHSSQNTMLPGGMNSGPGMGGGTNAGPGMQGGLNGNPGMGGPGMSGHIPGQSGPGQSGSGQSGSGQAGSGQAPGQPGSGNSGPQPPGSTAS